METYDTGPTIAVAAGDAAAAWNNGIWRGDTNLIMFARALVAAGLRVSTPSGVMVTCDATPRGVLAAMLAYAPGRAVVTAAPGELIDELCLTDAEYVPVEG